MSKLHEVAELLRANPGWGARKIAGALNISKGAAQYYIALAKGRNPNKTKSGSTAPKESSEPPKVGTSVEINGDKGFAQSVSPKIKTLADLLAYTEVNLNEWEVERFIVNKWEMGYKDANDNADTIPLFQVKAWLKRKAQEIKTREICDDFYKAVRKISPRPPPIKYRKLSDGHLLELSIFDHHNGKLCWSAESGKDYDLKIASRLFTDAVGALVSQSRGFNIDRILISFGQDYFHTDNGKNTTTAGTQVDADSRWQKSFIDGRKLAVETILNLRKICPVDVLICAGNHDTERAFYLGDALDCYFHSTPGVTVNNRPTSRKYYAYGNTLLGFTHGDKENKLRLPILMATETAANFWNKSKFREWHTGHLHHKKTLHFQPCDEDAGIRIRTIPSLTPSDAWHKAMGYDGLQAAEAFIWSKQNGLRANLSYSPSI